MSKYLPNSGLNLTNQHINNNHMNELNSTATSSSSQSSGDKIFTVSLLKRENGGLGFLIRQRDEYPCFSVWEIIKNGSAESSGKIKRGDLILKVNNEDLTNLNYEKGLEVLKSIKPGTMVELTLKRCCITPEYDDLTNNNNGAPQSIKFEYNSKSTTSSFMSPLQKFKKKFISCATNNTDGHTMMMNPTINTNGDLLHMNELHGAANIASSESFSDGFVDKRAPSTEQHVTHLNSLKAKLNTEHNPSPEQTGKANPQGLNLNLNLENLIKSPETGRKKHQLETSDFSKGSASASSSTSTSTTHDMNDNKVYSRYNSNSERSLRNMTSLKNSSDLPTPTNSNIINVKTTTFAEKIITDNRSYKVSTNYKQSKVNNDENVISKEIEYVPVVVNPVSLQFDKKLTTGSESNSSQTTLDEEDKHTSLIGKKTTLKTFKNEEISSSITSTNANNAITNAAVNNDTNALRSQTLLNSHNHVFNAAASAASYQLNNLNNNNNNNNTSKSPDNKTTNNIYNKTALTIENNQSNKMATAGESYDMTSSGGGVVGYTSKTHLPTYKQHSQAYNQLQAQQCQLSSQQPVSQPQPQPQATNHHYGSANSKNTIQIIQDGDDIRISIDGNIEILTNRNNDRRVISLSPQCARKYSNTTRIEPLTQEKRLDSIQFSADSESEEAKNKTSITTTTNKNNSQAATIPKRVNSTKSDAEQVASTSKPLSASIGNDSNSGNNQESTNNNAKSVDRKNEEQNESTSRSLTNRNADSTDSEPTTRLDVKKDDHKPILKSSSHYSISSSAGTAAVAATGSGATVSANVPPDHSPSKTKKKKGVKLRYLLDGSTSVDLLHHKVTHKVGCTQEKCMGSLLQSVRASKVRKSKEEIMEEAVDFINQFYASVKREGSKTHKERIAEIVASINNTGTYELKETELCFGARTAWRNAPRCIGRIQWSKLQVFDARFVTTARGMFEAVCNHIKYATNKGNLRSAITIFRQRTEPGHDFRIWNSQFISYAGYKIDEQTFIGDRAQLEFTEICVKLGWKPKYTNFDVLPLVLQANGQDPEWFEIPADLVVEIEITHPKFEWFRELNLKWYGVPGVASMLLDVGGVEFTACPFNGWYMGTEIGRDLADINRFDRLPSIAEKMGLDIKSSSSLWKDKALIELNHAILYSFQKANVTIIDHHTASESFMKHYENENKLRGGCPGDWVWIVPPLSSHLSPVFHLELLNYNLKPSYEYQDPPWKSHIWKQKTTTEEKSRRNKKRVYFSDIARAVKFSAKLMGKALARRVKCTILYATETGKSERFAKTLAEIFRHAFDAKVLCMKDYDVVDLEHETLLLAVTSTFGNGDPPENGEEFKKFLHQIKKENNMTNYSADNTNNESIYNNSGALTNVRFSVFGLGNSSYPKFCSFAKFLDTSLHELGAERIYELGLGDELFGQEESFRLWCASVFKSAVEAFCIDTDKEFIDSISKDDSTWTSQSIRLTPVENQEPPFICDALTKLHGRKILPSKLINKKNLQKENSGRVTLCIEISTHGSSSELQYKPGDHVGILGSNRKELVESLLNKITNAPPPDQLIKIEWLKEKTTVFGTTSQWTVDERYPQFTLRSALTYYLDITTPLTQKMLLYLSTQANNDQDRVQLEKLAKDHVAYEEWKMNGWPNLVEVLEEFTSVKPNASLLITQLPKLQPRFYSISSSPKLSDDIHITVGVVEYKPANKTTHYGVCSKWLDELSIGNIIPIFVRGAPSFRLPDDKTCPIIMVGAGTGIAPFRSFWQERKIDIEMSQKPNGVNGNKWGEMVLYFGCRQKSVDELYRNEIDQMVNENVITRLYSAYSREPNRKKIYVQDMLAANVHEVFDLIVNKKGHFYVCGDVRMAADVTHTLELALQQHMSLDEAKEYINQMRENLRFHEDIFGNSVNLTK